MKTSVRSIRHRMAAARDHSDAMTRKPKGAKSEFLDGFAYIQKDVLAGLDPESSYDLASSVRGGTLAFMDGASAARSMYGGDRTYADRIAAQYGVKLP